jgi:hypothetical protein
MGDRAREFCVRPETDEAFVISLIGNEGIHALGFDTDVEEWIQFSTADMEYSDEAADQFFDEINQWAESQFDSRLQSGELRMVGPDDPPLEDNGSERPKEVEKGLEAEYDCPDCDYYQTGTTTGPHSFLDHLKEEHGYSDTEAMEILQR